MSTLAADTPRIFETGHDEYLNEIAAKAAAKVYQGAAVGLSSSLARPLVAADTFAGFCTEQCDNSAGAASAIRCKVKSKGVVKLAVVGVTAVTDEGSTVYASDDNTFTLSSTGNSAIGKILRWETGTTCLVAFEAVRARSI